MPEFVPRVLIVLTGIVAILALFVGIRDFLQKPKHVAPVMNSGPATAAHPPDVRVRKKTNSPTKTTRTPLSQAGTSAGSATPAGIDDLIIRDFAPGGVPKESPKIVRAQSSHNEGETTRSLPSCTPLPNSTKPQDVDAPYYRNWGKEYGCNAY